MWYEIGTTNAHRWQSQSEGTIHLVPKLRKMVIIIPRREEEHGKECLWQLGALSESCRLWGWLGPHIIIIPASLSLPPMRGAVIGRAPTILQNDSFYTRISNFVQSPILSATSTNIQIHHFKTTFMWRASCVATKQKLKCPRSIAGVPSSQALPGFLVTAYHLCAFLM